MHIHFSVLIAGPDLDPYVLFRTIEILHSAYKDGHINIADYLSVFITLALRFKVSPGNFDNIHFLFCLLKLVLLSIILLNMNDHKELKKG